MNEASQLHINIQGKGNSAYYFKVPKKNQLSKHEKEIDDLCSENHKLKKEKKQLEEIISQRTKKMLEKYSSQEETIKLNRKMDEDKDIQEMTGLIQKFREAQKDSEKVIKAQNVRISNIKDDINSYKQKVKHMQHPQGDDHDTEFEFENIKKLEKEKRKIEESLQKQGYLTQGIELLKRMVKRRKFDIAKQYISEHKDDLEELIRAIYDHFIDLKHIVQPNPGYEGTMALIKKNRKELAKIENEHKKWEVKKDDIRYEVYNMISSIFRDNIQLRYKLSNYMEAYLKQTEAKIEDYYDNIYQEPE